MIKKNILNVVYIILLCQPILDLITSLMTKFLGTTATLGIIVRGLLFVVCLIYLLFISKSKYIKISRYYLYGLFAYLCIYFISKSSIFKTPSYLITEITYLIKYFYAIIILLFFVNFFEEYKPNNRKLFRILQINLFTYCFIILLANATGTAFGTYIVGKGNSGWFFSGNEISIIVTILYPLIFLLVNKTNSYKWLLYIIPIVFAIQIIGTKTSMLGLLLPTAFFFLYYLFRFKNKKKQFLITLVILSFLIFSLDSLPVIENVKRSINRYSKKVESNVPINPPNNEVVKNVLMSGRNRFKETTLKIYNESSLVDKCFGLGFVNRPEINNPNVSKLIEMDFYDIYFHYGIFGFAFYFIPFLFISFIVIKYLIKLKFKLNFKQILLGYMSYIGLLVSFLVGHTLGAPSVSIYLTLSFALLLYYMKNQKHVIPINDKKITILTLHLGIGGIEKYVQSLSNMLKDDYEVEIISTYKVNKELKFDSKIQIKYLINDYPHRDEFQRHLKEFKLLEILKGSFSLLKLLIMKYYKNIAIIENIDSKYIITTRVFHNKLVGNFKNRNIIAIATEHNYHDNNKLYVKKIINSCNNIDYLVVVSDELQKHYNDKLNSTKCIYIPNVIDNIPDYIKPSETKYKLIAVGRLVYEKGFDDMIDIIDNIKKVIPQIKLDIYGEGPLKDSLQLKIKDQKLEKNIKLNGFIENEKLLQKLNKYDIYLMTSITESFGIVLLEAMSRSIPCIAFDSASGPNILLNNNNGILVSNRDKNKFAKEVIELLNNKDKLKKISQNGYNSVKKYNIKNIKKEWIKLIKNEI